MLKFQISSESGKELNGSSETGSDVNVLSHSLDLEDSRLIFKQSCHDMSVGQIQTENF